MGMSPLYKILSKAGYKNKILCVCVSLKMTHTIWALSCLQSHRSSNGIAFLLADEGMAIPPNSPLSLQTTSFPLCCFCWPQKTQLGVQWIAAGERSEKILLYRVHGWLDTHHYFLWSQWDVSTAGIIINKKEINRIIVNTPQAIKLLEGLSVETN